MPPRHIALAVLVAVIWGANFVVIDLGLGDLPPTLFVALRFVVVLVPAIALVPRPLVPWRDVLLVGVFMSLGQFALLYTALAVGMPAGLASLVLQAQVGLTVRDRRAGAAGAAQPPPGRRGARRVRWGSASSRWVARSPPRRWGWCSSSPRRPRGRSATSWPDGRPAGAAPLRAAPPVTARTSGFGAGLSMTVWSALVVPLPLLALSLAIDGPDAVVHALTHLTGAAVLSTLYTAWLASLVGYGIWNTLLARHPAAAVVPYTMLVPVVGLTHRVARAGRGTERLGGRGRRAAAARGGRHDGRAGPPAASEPVSAGPGGGGSTGGRASADTRSMTRGSCSPTAGTCCWS